MSNQTRIHRSSDRARLLPAAARGILHRYASKRREAAYAAEVDYMVGLIALRSR